MAALATYLAVLSRRADELLEKHHQDLFDLGLDVSFNRATLATKYWLPLPGRDDPTYAHEDEFPHDESDEQLFSALRECERILERFETAALSKLHEILPNATSAFAQSVRKISRMIDARRQSFDSDSDSSRPGSTTLYTQDAGKAGPNPQSYGQLSPGVVTDNEFLRPSTLPAKGTQNLSSNTQTSGADYFDIPKDVPLFLPKYFQHLMEDRDDELSSLRAKQNQSHSPKSQDNDTGKSLHISPMHHGPDWKVADGDSNKGKEKKRKANNACVYCTRPHMMCDLQRPCSRCVKRDIGHLCHYESRGSDTYDKSGTFSGPARSTSGGPLEPEDQHENASRESVASSTIGPPPIKALPTVRDHTTDQLDAEGKEYLPREVDPSGETKVSEDGYPLDGRVFRCRTFQLPDRGGTLFMLATECARVLGYRDSYLLFNKNRSLFKIILNQKEKDNLIQQEILPYSYRSRQIAVATARSIFRQFGSRLIQDGRRVRDDYWELKARQQGFTEEDPAGEKKPGAARAREAAAAEALGFVPGHSLSNSNDRLGEMSKQRYNEEHAAGSLGIDYDKTLVNAARKPYKASQPGLGQEPPTVAPADSIMPTSTTSFAASRQFGQSASLDKYWRPPHESPE